MTIEELNKYVELELQWLRYYADKDSREKFDPAIPVYDQLVSIGYAKKVFPLRYRCGFHRITSDGPIREANLADVRLTDDVGPNVITSLEYMLSRFPDEHARIKTYLSE